MKTTILIAAVLSAGTVFACAQTNSATAKPTASATTNALPTRPTLAASSTSTAVVGDPQGKKLDPSAEKRTDVIEGRNYTIGGAVLRALGPERRNPLQLLNPFAPVTDRERRFSQRPPPHGFVDDRTIEPVGITIISVEKKK